MNQSVVAIDNGIRRRVKTRHLVSGAVRNRSMNKRGAKHHHNPAGSKAARMAAEHRLTLRGGV